ncbi:hypothetical protein ACET3Z_026339 [Daucus carota]
MDITTLSQLDPMSESERKIQVKLTRKWLQTDESNGNVCGCNMILVDSYDNRMHCWIPYSLLSQMEAVFFQGSIYELQKFEVCAYTGKFRCFDAETHIVLLPETLISPLDGTSFNIPQHIFHFTNLQAIASADLKDSHLVGIILFSCCFKQCLVLFVTMSVLSTSLSDVAGIVDAVGIFAPVTGETSLKHYYLDIVITDLM